MGYQLRVDDIRLEIDLDSDLPAVHADTHQLQQVLVNLLTNAQQAILGQGRSSGMISPEDMDLFLVTDDVETAVREITGFYRVYHSSRYVRDTLVLRLERRLDASLIERLNDEFSGLLATGRIRQQDGPLEGEGDECADLPRLVLAFDRQSVGQLRRMINVVNAGAEGSSPTEPG